MKPEHDYRGLRPGYIKNLASEDFALGMLLLALAAPAFFYGAFRVNSWWVFLGLLGLFLGAAACRYLIRAKRLYEQAEDAEMSEWRISKQLLKR